MTKNATELGNSPGTMTVNCVGAGLRIKGEISGDDDLVVEGAVEGPIRLGDHRLIVGSSARLNSEVVAREIIVHGSVKGNLQATDRIEITKSGSVVGNLTTARILIEDGASFKGSIEIDRKTPAANPDAPPLARTATASGKAQAGNNK